MFAAFPEIVITYELKEFYIRINSTCTLEDAPERMEDTILRFTDSGIEEYDPFYEMLVNWQTEIINSFTKDFGFAKIVYHGIEKNQGS